MEDPQLDAAIDEILKQIRKVTRTQTGFYFFWPVCIAAIKQPLRHPLVLR